MARNSRPNPWPYIYRAASVGLFGLPIRPFDCARSISQSTARRRLSACLPSRSVEPSMSIVMPASADMEVGYWPPLASQWPSRFWLSANHFRPLSTASRTLGGNSSARAAVESSPVRQTVRSMPRLIGKHSLTEEPNWPHEQDDRDEQIEQPVIGPRSSQPEPEPAPRPAPRGWCRFGTGC